MISKLDMMPMLVEACPSFGPAWRDFHAEWEYEADLPVYVSFSELARHLIEMASRGETEKFPAMFRVVERWCVEGDDYVREAAMLRVLEDL